jgi:hypothetical protein
VERRDNTAAAQPDEGGAHQLVWQLGWQLNAGFGLGKEKRGASKVF